jgi:hypothetical protein
MKFFIEIYNAIYHENLFGIVLFLHNSYFTSPPQKRKTVCHIKYRSIIWNIELIKICKLLNEAVFHVMNIKRNLSLWNVVTVFRKYRFLTPENEN